MTAPSTSVPNGTKLGRPPAPDRALFRTLFPDISDRSLARLMRSFRIITDLFGVDFWPKAVESVTRPNGSLNIAHLERASNVLLAQYVIEELDR